MKKLGMKDILWFGKYEGKSLRWVVDNDPGYILLELTKIENAQPSNHVLNIAEDMDERIQDLGELDIDSSIDQNIIYI